MMSKLWVVLFVALNGFHSGYGSPVRPTPQTYPHDAAETTYLGWGVESGIYAAVPALALVIAIVSILFGCTWCYKHKGRKPEEGTENQIFTASATHLNESRRVHPPDSGFSEPVNNNINEDNNNGPISLREMQNIANNNAAAYIVSENEERNRISRESVVEFEPLPTGFRVIDPLERCADWFGDDDFPRNHLQYLREISRGWFGRVVEGEIDDSGSTNTVAVKILNQNANLEDKARFLDEARMYRDVRHENVLAFIAKCLQEDPWILIFEFCSMDLQQYLIVNRPKMAILNESGVPLRLMSDVTTALAHLHSRGYVYGNLWSGAVLIRGDTDNARAVLGRYTHVDPQHDHTAPETRRNPPVYTGSSEVWSLGTLIWEVCAWGMTPSRHPPPLPDLPCPYRNHLYQVMQLCWNPNSESRPTSTQVQALINHLYITHTEASEPSQDDGYGSSDFEERWQRLKPNSIPKIDEHVAIIHAPSTSMTSHFTGSDQELDNIQAIHDTLSVDMDTAVSRSSSIMSDKDPLSVQIKSDSLTNLHGSLEDVRNIYLTHNEMAVLECHQGNIILEENKEKEHDKSDSSVDPWVKDIMAGSQDDVSYYKDVSDVIKNLDNILNSEKTSSSESSHQASPSRDNLTLDCKKDYPIQSSLVKSPGITNFQNILDAGFKSKSKEDESCIEDDTDQDTVGTLSHSFERHSDTVSQETLENLTPDTPMKDIDVTLDIEHDKTKTNEVLGTNEDREMKSDHQNIEFTKEYCRISCEKTVPKLKELCLASVSSVSLNIEHVINKDCQTPCDSILTERTDIIEKTKSIDHVHKLNEEIEETISTVKDILPNFIVQNKSNTEKIDIHTAIVNGYSTPQQIPHSSKPTDRTVKIIGSNGPNENYFSDLIVNSACSTKNEPLKISNKFIEVETMEIQKEENKESLSEPPQLINNSHKDSIETNIFQTNKVPENNIHENVKYDVMNTEIANMDEGLVLIENLDSKPHFKQIICDDEYFKEIISQPNDLGNFCPSQTHPSEKSESTSSYVKSDIGSSKNSIDSISSKYNQENKEPIDNKSINKDSNELEQVLISANHYELVYKTHEDFPSLQLQSKIVLNNTIQDKIKVDSSHESLDNVDNEMGIKHVDEVFTFLHEESTSNSDSENIGENNSKNDEIFKNAVSQENIKTEGNVGVDSNSIFLETKNETDLSTSYIKDSQKSCINKIINDNNYSDSFRSTELESKDMCTIDNAISTQNKACEQKKSCAPTSVKESLNHEFLQLDSEFPCDIARVTDKTHNNLDICTELSCVKPENTLQTYNKMATTAYKENLYTPMDCIQFIGEISTDGLQLEGNDSTAYMDLFDSDNQALRKDTMEDDIQGDIQSCFNSSPLEYNCLVNNESTIYLQLPNNGILKEVDNFLHMERIDSSKFLDKIMVYSTPITSDASTENALENIVTEHEKENISETEVPGELGVTFTKLDQTFMPENTSPFESPTKSHPTDTFDENSSVVLGPFENCSLELFKELKSAEFVDFPREELLAFSSNFSEINLETPSPLRDGNFLNEVPDLAHDNFVFDNIATISETVPEKLELNNSVKEVKAEQSEPQTETNTDESVQSVTEKRVSPSTPPNSPGVVNTPQQKYLVEIDLNAPSDTCQPLNTLQNEIDINQIELQITSKLAMAENENNMNIEYSGPLDLEDTGFGPRDPVPELYLAGNGGSADELKNRLTLDEECVQALRNELELKLPLAQVAAIEPPCENEWSLELPPPPELILNYPGALSPIAEETGHQLCAYENDTNWNASTRTDSSESYPEPCNNSTDEVTDIPTGGVHSEIRTEPRSEGHTDEQIDDKGESFSEEHVEVYSNEDNSDRSTRSDQNTNDQTNNYSVDQNNPHNDERSEPNEHSTYTIRSRDSSQKTYTVHEDVGSSKEMTMSADSLNAIPLIKNGDDTRSPINDTTFIKNEDEKESSCERISQVSPFLLSPTTDTSAPENSDNYDNATGVSTLSKTTVPTDAKLSKPSECPSKATSIDSWCSNDTLYNVEENFDDLAMDPDLPIDFAKEKDEGNSESTDTLTHNDEKDLSHCSTYIIHDSKSEVCGSFSPDSITTNDNYTFTILKTDQSGTTPVATTKSDVNDSIKNSQTKDLAYGTLMSGVQSYSNCTTEVASTIDDFWKLSQPELVRRSPTNDIDVTPPKFNEVKNFEDDSPHLPSEPQVKKMDSVEIACLHDSFEDREIENQNILFKINDNQNDHYKNNMAPSVTSTPFVELNSDLDDSETIPFKLPECSTESPECKTSILNFNIFKNSIEERPQDLSSNNDVAKKESEILLGGTNNSFTINSYENSLHVSDQQTPNYSSFANSAIIKAQDSNDKSSQIESGIDSEEFRQFGHLVGNLSSIIDASSLLLNSERMSSDLAMSSSSNNVMIQSESRISEATQSLDISLPNIKCLTESLPLVNVREPTDKFLISFDIDDEMEQPHSIIITEAPLDALKDNSNLTIDCNIEPKINDMSHTYDSHTSQSYNDSMQPEINGESNLVSQSFINTDSDQDYTNNGSLPVIANNFERSQNEILKINADVPVNEKSENYATVNFLSENFEELIESNVDDADIKDNKVEEETDITFVKEIVENDLVNKSLTNVAPETSKHSFSEEKQSVTTENATLKTTDKLSSVTDNFLQNEKKFCQLDSYLPLLNDIRFTGPATEIMTTSFTQESPTEPMSPECEQNNKPNTVGVLIKEWDSDSESSNSSSGEFIWKGGDGPETSVLATSHFQHQRDGSSQSGGGEQADRGSEGRGGGFSEGSGDSGSGSEGDEVEFVPSSWDCRAAPSKSSLRSLEQAPPDSKKRVVFKRQKYHCVYEYPRETVDSDAHSPSPYLPDFSTYSDWDPSSAEEAELGYGQLFGAPSPLDMYPLRSGIAFGSDYDEDFFISSSARPFESLGIMSTTSQFFPGMHVKPSLLERELSDDATEEFPPPPSPLPATLIQTRTPSMDFTTPDSGVEDITPGSMTDEDYKAKKLPESELAWRTVDSASSSESVSPSSPGGEALGGLRHTRDKLKLDLPPSPHIPSPRHNRVFNFVLDKPKRRSQDTPIEVGNTPLVMTDETPIVTTSLPLLKDNEDLSIPEPTFSTFGKSLQKVESEQKLILSEEDVEDQKEVQEEGPKVVEGVKGEGTVLDSGDEDSGIESSSKATLERNKTSNVS